MSRTRVKQSVQPTLSDLGDETQTLSVGEPTAPKHATNKEFVERILRASTSRFVFDMKQSPRPLSRGDKIFIPAEAIGVCIRMYTDYQYQTDSDVYVAVKENDFYGRIIAWYGSRIPSQSNDWPAEIGVSSQLFFREGLDTLIIDGSFTELNLAEVEGWIYPPGTIL